MKERANMKEKEIKGMRREKDIEKREREGER